MQKDQLEGQAAVVTGGSRGIGLAIARSLVAEGVDVLICSRSAEELSEALRQSAEQSTADVRHGRLESFTADVCDPSHMEAAVARAVDVFGQLDILVNNAGVGRFGQVDKMSIEDWKTVVETNLSGVFFACHAAIPVLRRRGGGWIINIGSLAGSHPFVGGSAYCASKAGLDALSDVLMQEVRHDNIRVSCVAPGSVSTRFADAAEVETAAWKLAAGDVSRVVVDLLKHDPRSLPSRVEIRPSRPRR